MVIPFRSLALCATLLVSAPALACPVCITAPERGTAQRLIEDDIVVLARPSSANPYQYEITEVLRGDAKSVAQSPPIPFLVSSTLRRQMANEPDLRVVMTYGPPEPGAATSRFEGQPAPRVWNKAMTVEPEFRGVIEQIIRAPGWGAPRSGSEPAPRFEFFAALHDHPDPRLRRLAWRELRTWPYDRLRNMPVRLDVSALRAVLHDINSIPDAPLAILMLANHGSEEACAAVRAGADRALKLQNDLTLGAWVLALVEQERTGALDLIAKSVLWPGGTRSEKRQAAVTGLISAADAIPELRGPTADILAETARRYPDLLPTAVAALLTWRDDRLARDVIAHLDGSPGLPGANDFLLRRYAAMFATGN